MGASTFQITSTLADPAAAYDQLVSEARFEDGNSPYSGTIATTSGFRVVSTAPVNEVAAQQIVAERIGKLSKWSACEAVAVGKSSVTRPRVVRMTLKPTGDESHLSVTAAAVAAALDVPVNRVESFTVREAAPSYRYTTVKPGLARKVWSTSRGGEFATRKEAVDYARTVLDMNTKAPFSSNFTVRRSVEIFEKVIRTPQASVQATLSSLKVVVDAEIAADGPRVFSHWLFYGWAAS